MRRYGWWASAALALSLVACSAEPEPLPRDASLADLVERFSGCDGVAIDRIGPASQLAVADTWIQVVSIEAPARVAGQDWEGYVVVDADGRTREDVALPDEDAPGIAWALVHGAPAWLAVDSDGAPSDEVHVAYTLVLAESGAFFPGLCMDAYLRSAVADATDVDATLRTLPTMTQVEIEALVRPGGLG